MSPPLDRRAVAWTRLASHRPRGLFLPDGVTVLGHRGWSDEAPENTFAAFDLAADAGFGLELDVGLSADRTPVVVHDDTLDRTTSGRGLVDRTSDAVLAELDAGSWFAQAHAGAVVPTLDAVLQRYGRRVPIDVEVKRPRSGGPWRSTDLGHAVADAIVAQGLTDRAFVSSFSPLVLAAIRRRVPSLRRAQLIGTFDGADLGRTLTHALRHLWGNRLARPDAVFVEHTLLTEAYVHALRRWGYAIGAWTVDDPDLARRYATWGVTVLVTNRPAAIAAAVGPQR